MKCCNCINLVSSIINSKKYKSMKIYLIFLLKLFNIWNINQIIDNFYALNVKIKNQNKLEKRKLSILLCVVCAKVVHQIFIYIFKTMSKKWHFLNFNFVYFANLNNDFNLIIIIVCSECALILNYVCSNSNNLSFLRSVVIVREILENDSKSRYKYFNLILNYHEIRKKVFKFVKMHNSLLQQFTVFIGKCFKLH